MPIIKISLSEAQLLHVDAEKGTVIAYVPDLVANNLAAGISVVPGQTLDDYRRNPVKEGRYLCVTGNGNLNLGTKWPTPKPSMALTEANIKKVLKAKGLLPTKPKGEKQTTGGYVLEPVKDGNSFLLWQTDGDATDSNSPYREALGEDWVVVAAANKPGWLEIKPIRRSL